MAEINHEAKLSLQSRKNLKAAEESKAESIAKIEGATGKSGITYEFDEIVVDAALEKKNYKNRIGDIIVKSRLSELADKIVPFCEDQLQKDTLNALWTSNKITFNFDENTPSYQDTGIENGDLRMRCKESNVWSNISQLADALPTNLVVPGGLGLKSEKNLKDNQEKMKGYLQKIEGFTGKSGLIYEFDKFACEEAVVEKAKTNVGKIGEIVINSRLENLTQFLEKFCSDEDNKEALLELWTSNKIRFELNEQSEKYQNTKLENGDFVMYCKKANIWTNMGQLGDDLEAKL